MNDLTTSSSGGAAVTVEQLSVPFGASEGLVDVSFALAQRQRLAIIGPSGAGKTTLLRAIAGLARVSAGCVRVAGRDVTALAPERRDVVYLHQHPVLFEHLDIGENAGFALRVRRVPDERVRTQVAAALDAVRLHGFERRLPRTLSGGQRHRVALARAIAARPAVLLLDEPLSALDPSLRDEVRGAIVDAHAEGSAALILATHDLDDAGVLADLVAVLINGTIAQLAEPSALFAHPATLAVAQLLGVYQQIPGTVRADGAVECALGVVPNARGAPAHARVVVAFRRAALHVSVGAMRPGAVPAHVASVRARADETTLELRLDAVVGVPTLEARNGTGTALDVGAECIVSLDPSGALIFPA